MMDEESFQEWKTAEGGLLKNTDWNCIQGKC